VPQGFVLWTVARPGPVPAPVSRASDSGVTVHELPVTEAMLTIALDAAAAAGSRRVLAIEVVVGDLTSFVDESVRFYFDLLSVGTAAEGAELRFRRVPGVASCRACGRSRPMSPPLDPRCPDCGDLSLRVTGGDELRIESIEVDE
jgi:hydrogenase nickel incorporation protein HypA/HybF